MIQIRKANQRGHANHDWLDTYHTFSFADYYDPKQMGFRALRVINEDFIDGGNGFPTHGHKNMEIITYVISGAIEHRDTLGNTGLIRPGDVQRMSAGTGISHSEKNGLENEKTHLLQIWILPEKEGLAPGYEQKSFETAWEKENFLLLASKNGEQGAVSLNQDVKMYAGKFRMGETRELALKPGRHVWIQMIEGTLGINGETLQKSDGAALSEVNSVQLTAKADSHFIVFDLP